jgi:hypothetical protein
MPINTDPIPGIAASVWKAAPEPVYWGMWEDNFSFEEAMDEYVGDQLDPYFTEVDEPFEVQDWELNGDNLLPPNDVDVLIIESIYNDLGNEPTAEAVGEKFAEYFGPYPTGDQIEIVEMFLNYLDINKLSPGLKEDDVREEVNNVLDTAYISSASQSPGSGDPIELYAPAAEPTSPPTEEPASEKSLVGQVLAKDAPDASFPSYREQFSRVFDNLRGSHRYEAQRGKASMFKDVETLYYLLEDWEEHPWVLEGLTGAGDMTMALDAESKDKEEERFGEWFTGTYVQAPKETRYGKEFYQSVMDLRDSLLKIEDNPEMTETELYNLLRGEKGGYETSQEAQKTVMKRIAFMGQDDASTDRLAHMVGMYNIHPGTDAWMKQRMMVFYSDMLNNWLLSGRTSSDFLRAFVKDKPAFSGKQPSSQGGAPKAATSTENLIPFMGRGTGSDIFSPGPGGADDEELWQGI